MLAGIFIGFFLGAAAMLWICVGIFNAPLIDMPEPTERDSRG
jgi:hypothetical protein